MGYNKSQRVFLIRKFNFLKNASLVRRAWRTKFKNLPAPSISTIHYINNKFNKTGSVVYIQHKHAKPTAKREDSKNRLKIIISEDPTLSIRKLSVELGVSYNLTRDILRVDLRLKPYKYGEKHELKHQDYQKRLDFAHWFLKKPKNANQYLICTDEAFFYLKESVNKQNNRMWLESKPEDWIEKPLHDQKVLVWCGISATKIYGPYYFDKKVNQHNYLDMLKKFFWPKHLRTKDYQMFDFQQDGATPHTACIVQNWLTDHFGTKFWNKQRWPPRSPDLNPCDFFLWGYLKSKVYKPLPKNLDDLKANIEREIKNIDKTVLKSTFLNFEKRCKLLIDKNGGHVE